MDRNVETDIAEDRKQARRERDRARRNSLTAEQKEEINARRRAQLNSLTVEQKEEINARKRAQKRAKLNSLTAEEREEINERRRATRRPTSTQTLNEEKRATLQAQRRANAAARRNIPCAESIAMLCPNAIALPTGSTTHESPTTEGSASPLVSSSMSMPAYTIRTDGNTRIFYMFIYVKALKASHLQYQNVVGDMEAFLSGIMDNDANPNDLMDNEHYMFAPEGIHASLSISPLYQELILHIDVTPYACRY
jgi:hypothetical protein